MAAKTKAKGLEINEDGIFLDGKEIPGVTSIDISKNNGSPITVVNLEVLVTSITVKDKTLIEINKVKIPKTVEDRYENKIIETLVEHDMIDPERI